LTFKILSTQTNGMTHLSPLKSLTITCGYDNAYPLDPRFNTISQTTFEDPQYVAM